MFVLLPIQRREREEARGGQVRQDARALDLDSVERTGIEAENLQNRGRDLHRLNPAGYGAGLEARVRHQQHDVGVVEGKATVLRLFLRT